jgi:hypothetical protein
MIPGELASMERGPGEPRSLTVAGCNDNTVVFGRLRLQIEPSPLRTHFVKATVQVRRYADHTLAIFYRPRCIGRYDPDGATRHSQPQAA